MTKPRGVHPWQVLTGAVFLTAAFCATALRCAAQEAVKTPPSAQATTLTEQRDIAGKQQWTDTAIDLAPGDVVIFHASGTLHRPGAAACGPDGRVRDWHDVTARYPVKQAGAGELLARIGVGDNTSAFAVGSHHETKVALSGRLYLGVNESSNESAAGGYHVTIEIERPAPATIAVASFATAAGSVLEAPSTSFPAAGLSQIPLRVTNSRGEPGDMVNFILIGSEASVDQAFKDAGWLKVVDDNKDHRRAALGGVASSFRHRPFVEMPMSQLFLFGRPQDVGYARGVAVAALGSRHHLRLWKAPMQVDGQDVWVGAATHDKSFMHDPHHAGFSHYIDPNVDDERAYIHQTLAGTHEAIQWTMVQPANPVQTALTVSGQQFHSDGQLFVLWLHAQSQNQPEIAAQATGSTAPTDGAVTVPGANAFNKN